MRATCGAVSMTTKLVYTIEQCDRSVIYTSTQHLPICSRETYVFVHAPRLQWAVTQRCSWGRRRRVIRAFRRLEERAPAPAADGDGTRASGRNHTPLGLHGGLTCYSNPWSCKNSIPKPSEQSSHLLPT